MTVMGTTTFHLIGYAIVAVMWAVALYGLFEIARNLRPYLAPHTSAIFNAVREDWTRHRPRKQVVRQSVARVQSRPVKRPRRAVITDLPDWAGMRTV
ncbi:hypothetical protein [Govanella unica]|uniref:Uncharacterized protein n=1 Tax=Govanella unica TaxID=2975056 RepID=A0A9X3TYZ2_9PROT|nr:hypothetical protein [Govania unica]MDA5194383.1 hypothetical protein [Govania unica]